MTIISEKNKLFEADYHQECRFNSLHFYERDIATHTFLECEFSSCVFEKAELSHTVFNSCKFISSSIISCDIEGTAFHDVLFRECKVAGLNFSNTNPFAFSPQFTNSILVGCMFFSNNLSKMKFNQSQLRNTDFIECNLKCADFKGSIFESIEFSKCNLEKAIFSEASGYMINPFENRIEGAKFDLPEAQSFLGYLGIDID